MGTVQLPVNNGFVPHVAVTVGAFELIDGSKVTFPEMVITRVPPDGMFISTLVLMLVLTLASTPVLRDPGVTELKVAGSNEMALLIPSGEQPMKLGTDTLTVSQV